MKKLQLRAEGLNWREIEDEVVAVDTVTSTYLSANGSGLLLWRELARGATHDELVSRLVDAYGIDRERASGDVDQFVEDLSTQGLLA